MKHRPAIPATDVLKWLADNHPELHAKAVAERDWVWLAEVNLSGDHNKATRESLTGFGFVFKSLKRPAHLLPDGRGARWAHHGSKPIPFKRKGRDGGGERKGEASTETQPHALDASLAGDIENALAQLGLA